MPAKASRSTVLIAARAFAAAMLPLGLASCASNQSTSGRSDVVVAEGDELLPSATVADWRYYSDHLVRVRVVAVERGQVSEDDKAVGEGYVPRNLTFAVEDLLWSRPGSPAAPERFTIEVDGWTFHGKTERPLRFQGEPMINVGHDYVLPIVFLTKGTVVTTAGWSNLGVRAIVPADKGVLGEGDTTVGGPAGRPARGPHRRRPRRVV